MGILILLLTFTYMIKTHQTNRINTINKLAIIALIFTLAITTIITTNTFAQDATVAPALTSTTTAVESTILNNELEWVEDDNQTYYPTAEDTVLSDEEVKSLGLEAKFEQKAEQSLKLEFKTDLKTQLNLKGQIVDTTTRQAELNVVADSINKDFQAEQKAKRDEETKKISEFNKLTNLVNEVSGLYNDVSHKVDTILKTPNEGTKVVTDVVLDNIQMDNNVKGVLKLLINGNLAPSDYNKYNFDQDINRVKNIFK